MRRNPEWLRGTLDVLALKVLSLGPEHGYGIGRWIEAATEDLLQIEEGSLYPALHRLEQRSWVDSEWGLSENNRRAKYYRLTRKGRRHLREETSEFELFATAILKALQMA